MMSDSDGARDRDAEGPLLLPAAVAILRHRRKVLGTVLATVIIVVSISLWKLFSLGDPVAPGIGLYLTILGGIGMLIGGGLSYQGHIEQSATEPSR
jgi:hypothetical protein